MKLTNASRTAKKLAANQTEVAAVAAAAVVIDVDAKGVMTLTLPKVYVTKQITSVRVAVPVFHNGITESVNVEAFVAVKSRNPITYDENAVVKPMPIAVRKSVSEGLKAYHAAKKAGIAPEPTKKQVERATLLRVMHAARQA